MHVGLRINIARILKIRDRTSCLLLAKMSRAQLRGLLRNKIQEGDFLNIKIQLPVAQMKADKYVDSYGYRVYLGYFDSNGFNVNNWYDAGPHDHIGLASSRQFFL